MSPARFVAYLAGGAAALGAATYLVVYLYRWQWQRAILSGVLLLVVEVLLLGLVALDRLARLERRLRESDRRQEEILTRLRQAAPAAPARPAGTAALGPVDGGDAVDGDAFGGGAARGDRAGHGQRFAWLGQALDRQRHTYVFVPVLMAAGVALSGLAWLVERIARRTVRPAATRRLATRLAPLAAPPGGIDAGAPELPDRPALGPPRRRRWATAVGWAAVAAAGAVLVVGLARLTQTKPPERGEAASATTVLFTVDSHGLPPEQARLKAGQQWERCRDATSVPLRRAGMTELDDNLYAATVYPSLSDHDELRLRGCLQDATLDRVRLRVIGTGGVLPAADR